jgi:hypothetical protein
VTCAGRPQLPFVVHTQLHVETPRLCKRLEGLQTPRVGQDHVGSDPKEGSEFLASDLTL